MNMLDRIVLNCVFIGSFIFFVLLMLYLTVEILG